MNKEDIIKLREETGAGVLDCKKALEESQGSLEEAKKIIHQKGLQKAQKKTDRETSQGVVEAYVHNGSKVGVILELQCETDFVALNSEFKNLAHELAMHISASNPKDLNELLGQKYIRDMNLEIKDLINRLIAKVGENIVLKRFVRYELDGEQ